MAAPSYTEDLTDIDLAESGSTGWTAFNISGGGGGAPAFGADFGMQGGGCWDKAASNAERGLAVNKTPGAGTVAAGVHIFQWGFAATPGVTDTLANRGAYVLIGTSTTDFMQFHVEGSDTFGAQGRVGKCYVVDYKTTGQTDRIPYATVNGTPGATPTYFGYGLKTLATVKGSNMGADAVRYGTGAYLTAGELISAGDASDDPCTFVGFNVQNDDNNNRWGILNSIGGSNYELQGTFAIGQNNAGTATLCRFRDSDRSINIVDTVHSESGFTKFIFDHASTRVEWNNINLTALGGWNKGTLDVTTNNPTVVMTGGTFTGIGLTTLRSNTTANGVTWRAAGEVTANGATLANSTIIHGASIIDAQTHTSYDNSPTGDGSFSGGTGHVLGDLITLNDDTVIEVDAVSGGVVTQFTVDATRSKVFGGTRTQVSTDGAGTGFTLTPDTNNYTESSGLIWNTAADPNGELDNMTFDTLTAPMGHAIEFSTATPTTMTLTGIDFGTNYSATEGGSVGNETFWFRRTTGSVTLSLVNCTGNFGYKTDGASITIQSAVTLSVTVQDDASPPNLLEDIFVSIRNASTNALISEGRTNASGLYSVGINYTGDVAVNVFARRSSPGYTRYLPATVAGTITGTGLSSTVTMQADPNAALWEAQDFRVVRHGVVTNDVSGTTLTSKVAIPSSTTGGRKIVAMFGFRGGTSQTISGTPQVNGQNMTLFATEITQTDERVWGYYYDVPNTLAAGTYDMTVTFSAAVPERVAMYAIYNKAATGAPDASTTDDGAGVTTDPTFTLVPTNTNNKEVAFVLTDDLTTPAAGGTGTDVRRERNDEFVSAGWQGIVMSNRQATAASHTIIADISTSSKQYAGVAASISEA